MLETKEAIRWEDHEDYYREEMENSITPEMIEMISSELEIPASKAYGVVTFYNYFSMVPKGKYIVQVCTGTSCYVKGGQKLLDAFNKKIGLKPKGITDDGLFSLDTVRCLGACGLSPVISVNGEIHGRVKPGSLEDILGMYR